MQNNTEMVTYENDYEDSDDNNDTDTDNDKEISYNDTDNVSTQMNDNHVDNDTQNINTTRRFGRTSKIPKKYNNYLMMTQDPSYNETILIGAGLGEGITQTLELKVKNYSKAMSSDDKEKWIKAIDNERKRMVHYNVWTAIDRNKVRPEEKNLTTMWEMKKRLVEHTELELMPEVMNKKRECIIMKPILRLRSQMTLLSA
jgi:hypothetical protein